MSLDQVIKKIIDFRNERDWEQFHKVKDLLLGLNIEVSELQELFLWKHQTEIDRLKRESKSEIEDEIADILIFLVYLSEEFEIDLIKAIENKLEKNRKKYPVEKSKGSNRKYDQL